jgi:hypothetical protein
VQKHDVKWGEEHLHVIIPPADSKKEWEKGKRIVTWVVIRKEFTKLETRRAHIQTVKQHSRVYCEASKHWVSCGVASTTAHMQGTTSRVENMCFKMQQLYCSGLGFRD